MEPTQRYRLDTAPNINMRTAIFQAKYENLDAIREYVAQAAQDAGFDEAGVYAVQLSADEACSNIIEHAYKANDDGEIECTCSQDGKNLVIIFRDHGCCFDPASVPEPVLTGTLNERQIGGLGIYLIRHLMDEVHYETLGEAGNILTLKKRLMG
jgi:anti-sigma regulatory factor (Ser/Thr protein kinase)